MPQLASLRHILQHVPTRLEHLSPDKVATKPSPSTWSPKEELGHLLDSAADNHQRIVRAQAENHLAMPGYDQKHWVTVNAYQRRDWKELIEVWQALNRQLLAAAESTPGAAWSNQLTVGSSEPMTLEFVFDDYLVHMLHHLHHIGIEVDLKSNATTAA